jgi:predicted metalloprotease with PDZ domain
VRSNEGAKPTASRFASAGIAFDSACSVIYISLAAVGTAHRHDRTTLSRSLLRSALRSAVVALLVACGATGKTGSIGAVLSRDSETGTVQVHEAPPGLAAESAGLVAGDDIKMIDGVLVDDLDAEAIQRLLRGPVGSQVTLTVIRGDEVIEVGIERQELGTAAAPKERYERIE